VQQKNASLFTSDPLVEYNPTDNTIDYVNATIDLLRQYLKLQAARQEQKVSLSSCMRALRARHGHSPWHAT
jgi:hypothetical protein